MSKKDIYVIKDKCQPDDFAAYLEKLKISCKEEKASYRKNVKNTEKMFLSFWGRNKTVILCISFIVLLMAAIVVGISLVQDNNLDILKTENSEVYVEKEAESKQDEVYDSNSVDTTDAVDDVDVTDNEFNDTVDGVDLSENEDNKHPGKKKTVNKLSVGDTVYFNGSVQYTSSYAKSSGIKADSGKAKITKINSEGIHKYHLISINPEINIFGWVDEKYINSKRKGE